MVVRPHPGLLVAAAAWLFFGYCAWALYGGLLRDVPAQDFMVFYTAARAAIEGHLPLLADGNAFTADLNARFAAWLSEPLNLHPWVYPPSFLLLVLPFGALPFPFACGLFLVLTFALLLLALCLSVPPGAPRRICALALALSPPAAFTVAVGQNGFLTTALMVGGFGLLATAAGRGGWRVPLGAGALLGLLACKPQLWLLVPVALIAARQWRALACGIAAAGLLALASAAAFGLEPWRAWVRLMLWPNPAFEQWMQFGRLNGQSLYAEAVLLGAPAGTARLVQALASAACAAVVWWCFRHPRMPHAPRLAVLLTATVLAAPHVSNYDAMMVTVAVALGLGDALANGYRPGELVLITVVWAIELLDPPRVIPGGLVTPLVYCLFIAWTIARARRTAAPEVAAGDAAMGQACRV